MKWYLSDGRNFVDGILEGRLADAPQDILLGHPLLGQDGDRNVHPSPGPLPTPHAELLTTRESVHLLKHHCGLLRRDLLCSWSNPCSCGR